jgi:hypothetical protein
LAHYLPSILDPFHAGLSKDVELRAEVFIARCTPAYAIFDAIAYPGIFTTELFQVGRSG